MTIRNKINLSFLTTFVLVSSLIGVVVGMYTTSLIKKDIYAYLHSSNRARAEHIRTFIQDQKKTSVILAAASVYRDFLKEPINSTQYPTIKGKIDKRLIRTIEADPQIDEAFIVSRDGKVIASSDKLQEGKDKSNDDYFIKAKTGTYFKDVYYSNTLNKINYTVSSPVLDDNGTFLGVSVLRYIPENFFSIVKNENGLGDTEENFLVNKEKYFITPSRFLGETVILKQKVETENVNDCYNPKEMEYVEKNGYGGLNTIEDHVQIVEARDYRNISVIATHAYIPETGWCLVTKADATDLMSFRTTLIIIFLSIFITAGIIYFIIAFILSKKITEPIDNLKIGVNKIRSGNFDHEVIIDSKDEIAELSNAFNDMVIAVKQSRADIEMKVEEQTREISTKAKELDSQKSAILNILEDVEKEKTRAESLADDLAKFKLAVENASDHIVITDTDGIVIYANKGVRRITGFEQNEVIGKKAGAKDTWGGLMPKEVYTALWDKIKNKKEVFIGQLKNRRKNGEEYDVLASIAPVLDENGTVLFFVGIERDITLEKQIDRAKTEFVSLASHQLRTPLSAINWYTEMLLDGDAGKINKKQKKYLEEVNAGNQRMVDLVNALLNVSRLDLGTFMIEPEQTDIVDVAKSIIDELKPMITAKHITINEKYPSNIPLFMADKKLYRILIQNLMSNAVKYTHPNGAVTLEYALLTNKTNIAGRDIQGNSLLIKVSDNGIGVPKNQRDKIFEKLFRADNARETETEGTGLGLYIIKSIVDQSGGAIWFESEENKGSTFYISFPLSGMKKKEGTKKLD